MVTSYFKQTNNQMFVKFSDKVKVSGFSQYNWHIFCRKTRHICLNYCERN